MVLALVAAACSFGGGDSDASAERSDTAPGAPEAESGSPEPSEPIEGIEGWPAGPAPGEITAGTTACFDAWARHVAAALPGADGPVPVTVTDADDGHYSAQALPAAPVTGRPAVTITVTAHDQPRDASTDADDVATTWAQRDRGEETAVERSVEGRDVVASTRHTNLEGDTLGETHTVVTAGTVVLTIETADSTAGPSAVTDPDVLSGWALEAARLARFDLAACAEHEPPTVSDDGPEPDDVEVEVGDSP